MISRSPAVFVDRTCSTTAIRATSGDVGIAVNPALATRIRDADVLLVIGERLGEMTTSGYTLVSAPLPTQALIHVHPGVEELGRVYRPAVAIAATPAAFLAALAKFPALPGERWRASTAAAHAEYEAWRMPRPVPGDVDLWQVVRWLDERLPDDAILANGAGNYTTWLHRVYRYRGIRARSSRRTPARWATAFPPRSPRSSCIRRASSSRGTATAVS